MIEKYYPGGINEDVLSPGGLGRLSHKDSTNSKLLTALMKEYIRWHELNHHFHDTYQQDKRNLRLLSVVPALTGGLGIAFAAIVINPNMTSRNSYYLRKINAGLFGMVFFFFGAKKYGQQKEQLVLKMHDYLPLEVKRAVSSRDHRHLLLFNWEQPGRKLFDETTGKSLS